MIETIQQRAKRGREFEKVLEREWNKHQPGLVKTQQKTEWKKRKGRIDIFIDDGELMLVVEAKSTDWDKIKRTRLKEYAKRHLRQLFRYVDGVMEQSKNEGKNLDACLGVTYPREPTETDRLNDLKMIFDEYGASLSFENEPENYSVDSTRESLASTCE